MEYNKKQFIREKLRGFNLSEKHEIIVMENMLLSWDESFDFLPGDHIMPYLMKKGIDSENAYDIAYTIRKKENLKEEYRILLSTNDISLDFIRKYQNTLPDQPVGAHFIQLMIDKVEEIKL